MKVSSNIGIINALIRITLGFTILSWTTAKLVKRPWRDSYLVMAMIGAMKVAEGILRYCPVTDLLDKSGDNDDKKSSRGFGGLKGMDMFNVKDMLKSNKKSNDSTGLNSHDNDQNTTATKTSKKDSGFNPEDLSNKEVQEALNGDPGKPSSKTSSFDNQGFTQI
jgi:Protein of unknown function (DUF2892)